MKKTKQATYILLVATIVAGAVATPEIKAVLPPWVSALLGVIAAGLLQSPLFTGNPGNSLQGEVVQGDG